jgi:MFS family permease
MTRIRVATLTRVFFWVKTIALYVVTVMVAFLLSLILSFCAVFAWAGPNDDSPAVGMLWAFLFVVASGVFLPLLLGLVAERVQSKVLARRFSWSRGLRRAFLGLPIIVGPVNAWWVLLGLREDARPAHWLIILSLLLCVSAVCAYLALRIRTQVPHVPQ